MYKSKGIRMKTVLLSVLLSLMFTSCSEEKFTIQGQSSSFSTQATTSYSLGSCSNHHTVRPMVDILYVVDNSSSSFSIPHTLKEELKNTIATLSSDFDYHVYIAPLIPISGEGPSSYRLLLNNPDSVTSDARNNLLVSGGVDNISLGDFFQSASGGSTEYGFKRVKQLIDGNRSNLIFRKHANIMAVMISTEDDEEGLDQYDYNGSTVVTPFSDNGVYNSYVSYFKRYTAKYYSSSNSVPSNALMASQFRFLSVVPHTTCQSGFRKSDRYKKMSSDLHFYNGGSSSYVDSYNLCSGEYAQLFANINSTIQQILVEYQYNHVQISTAGPASIQEDDITVYKVLSDGSQLNIPASSSNGFEYLGYVTTPIETRSFPNDPNVANDAEPKSGHMIRLNGTATFKYPECVIAKTRTPTEYFGYIAIDRKPEISTVQVFINGQEIPQSSSNGWTSYSNNQYQEVLNIKVPGPTNAAVTPTQEVSGYILQLHGTAIYTNGDSVVVHYDPAP